MANEIYGNLKGIRNSVIEELKTFYDIRLEGGQLLTSELALRMADVTDFINREAFTLRATVRCLPYRWAMIRVWSCLR